MTEPRLDRSAWTVAVRRAAFPQGRGAVEAALLTLADVMGPDGRLRASRAEMVAATHLNVRTLTRYLTWAVEAGWLVHERRGGNGRTGVYLAAIGGSTDRSSGPELSHNSRRRNAKVAHNSTPRPAR